MEMLHYDFMQRAFCAGGLIAIIASLLGMYLMLRRQALMADMLSHVSLAGVAGGAFIHIHPTLGGFVVATVGAVLVEYVRRSYKSFSEISVAIIMIGGLSSAVIIMSFSPSMNKGLSAYLFGSVVAVNETELSLMLIVAAIGGLFFFLFRRQLYQITFDEETARTNGIPVKWISLGFSVLTGMIVSAAMPIVGVLLVSSLIVLPAALAIRIAHSFTASLLIAMGVGLLGVFSGLTASYSFSTPPGGTIAILLLLLLILGLGIQKAVVRFRKTTNKNIMEDKVPVPFIQTIRRNF